MCVWFALGFPLVSLCFATGLFLACFSFGLTCLWFAFGYRLVCLGVAIDLPLVGFWFCLWSAFGLPLVWLRIAFGLLLISFCFASFWLLVCIWFACGLPSVRFWFAFGSPLVCLWLAFGLPVVCLWFASRLWLTVGLILVCLWFASCFPLVCFWVAFSLPLDCLWFYPRFAIGLLLASCGLGFVCFWFALGVPWFTYGLPLVRWARDGSLNEPRNPCNCNIKARKGPQPAKFGDRCLNKPPSRKMNSKQGQEKGVSTDQHLQESAEAHLNQTEFGETNAQNSTPRKHLCTEIQIHEVSKQALQCSTEYAAKHKEKAVLNTDTRNAISGLHNSKSLSRAAAMAPAVSVSVISVWSTISVSVYEFARRWSSCGHTCQGVLRSFS